MLGEHTPLEGSQLRSELPGSIMKSLMQRLSPKGQGSVSRYAFPMWVSGCLVITGAAALASIALRCRGWTGPAEGLGDGALILTLLVIIVYTHTSSLSARAASYPPVSFWLSGRRGYWRFGMKNHANVPVYCRCELNPSCDGVALHSEGFYAGLEKWPVMPRSEVHGAAFSIESLFKGRAEDLWARIQRELKGLPPRRHVVRFRVVLAYEAPEFRFTSAPIEQRYYYDLERESMVLDY